MQVIEKVKTQVSKAIENVSFKVETPVEYEKASKTLKQARKLLRFVDEQEKIVTKPLNEGLRKARDLFRPWKVRLNQIIAELNANLSKFRQKQEEEAREKQRKLDEEAKPDDIFKPVVEPEIPSTNIKTRKVWKWRLKDKSKIKPDFLIPDTVTINELVRKLKDKAPAIIGEGIEIYTVETNY